MNSQKYNELTKQREEIDRRLKELWEAAKIDTARSDDYAWLEFDDLQFYYGYEALDDEESDDYEWHFYAIKDGNRKSPQMKISEHELLKYNRNMDDVQQGLATGIALYIREHRPNSPVISNTTH